MTSTMLHERVSDQAGHNPDAPAVVLNDESLTYGELEAESNRLARLAVEFGCSNQDRICLFVPKGPHAIVAMLATLKTGAAYVPVDLESPASRVAKVLEACEPKVIMAHPQAGKVLDALGALVKLPPVITLGEEGIVCESFRSDASLADARALPEGMPSSSVGPDDCADILFTSGSTGAPKGVMITHRNVTAFLDWACDYFNIRPGEQVSGHSPLHFDLSTFDIYGTLTRGATLHMIPPQTNLLAHKLAELIRERTLDQWFSVPSILTYMANFDVVAQDDFPQLKRLIWCGEVMPTPTLQYWMQRLPHVTFTNLYGPTEATIASSYYTVPKTPVDAREQIPIGTACDGEQLLVLNEQLEPTATDEKGEIYIGGVGLSPGYWRDETRTREVFIDAPERSDARLYKTGDLGKQGIDGLVYYLGRADSQIKSRGHRIELGEIEAALNALNELREVAVVGIETDGFEGTAICCAYVAASAEVTVPVLRRELAELVPRYMLPSRWLAVEALPKNANGKIDKPAVRELFAAQRTEEGARAAGGRAG